MGELIRRLIIWYLKKELKNLRKQERNVNTPYIFINGTGKDYPNYLVFTDIEQYRKKLHRMV